MYHVPIVRNGIFQVCYDPLTTVATVFESSRQRKEAKSAAAAADQRQQAAQKKLRQAQETASAQASARVEQQKRRARSGGQTIYTSPLGIGGTASVARKKLLGE